MQEKAELEFDDETENSDVVEKIDAVVNGMDWTTETIVSQMRRGNIILNPSFQRRDAWDRSRKSKLIESLIVGLPVPQIVLAEARDEKGKFIVLDGKQRLLAIMQFWGEATGSNNGFKLSGLNLRSELNKVGYSDLESREVFSEAFNALCNHTIRTVAIRNWKSDTLLNEVFLRLNTGSVKLSPQELRQALKPGKFTTFVDLASIELVSLKTLLNLDDPDPRMRDVEILARFLAFKFFASEYPGRMKKFLDDSFERFNTEWETMEPKVVEAVSDFDRGLKSLLEIFGDHVARKPKSRFFNRAIFDALIHFQSISRIAKHTESRKAETKEAYESLFAKGSGFLKSVESDTAGFANTETRFKIWAGKLESVTGWKVKAPTIPSSK